jgi:Cu-Zn family superoxide dismutase
VLGGIFTARVGQADQGEAVAELRDTGGAAVGWARFEPDGDAVHVKVRAYGLAPGFHGFHVHAFGICEGSVGFATAGGHYNPAGTTHGHHAGDMPSLLVKQDGTAELDFRTDSFTVGQLLDAGSAVIVHAGPDNFANIPSRYLQSTSLTPGPDAVTPATAPLPVPSNQCRLALAAAIRMVNHADAVEASLRGHKKLMDDYKSGRIDRAAAIPQGSPWRQALARTLQQGAAAANHYDADKAAYREAAAQCSNGG